MLRFVFIFRWITLSAWSAFGIWILLQLFGAYAQIHKVGSVASLAHLGGVLAGMWAWLLWRNLDTKPDTKTTGRPQLENH